MHKKEELWHPTDGSWRDLLAAVLGSTRRVVCTGRSTRITVHGGLTHLSLDTSIEVTIFIFPLQRIMRINSSLSAPPRLYVLGAAPGTV